MLCLLPIAYRLLHIAYCHIVLYLYIYVYIYVYTYECNAYFLLAIAYRLMQTHTHEWRDCINNASGQCSNNE